MEVCDQLLCSERLNRPRNQVRGHLTLLGLISFVLFPGL